MTDITKWEPIVKKNREAPTIYREILDGDGRISMEDLLGPLQDKPGFGKLRKRMDQMKKSEVIEAPLPQAIREKVERGTA